LPFLGEVPLKPEIRDLSDRGLPIAARADGGAAPFLAIATAVRAGLDAASRAAPRIVVE
jgi:hypothetical protein